MILLGENKVIDVVYGDRSYGLPGKTDEKATNSKETRREKTGEEDFELGEILSGTVPPLGQNEWCVFCLLSLYLTSP